jgi:GNAT superfamily N-acetyltransferase
MGKTMNKKDFFVSGDKKLMQLDRIHKFLSTEAYWCLGIPKRVVAKAVDASLCFGVFQNTAAGPVQVGFARLVTDDCTFAWLCDVYVEPEFRGLGLSSLLMKEVMAHKSIKALRRICLATRDAHFLYSKFGFKPTSSPTSWMEIKNNAIYKAV